MQARDFVQKTNFALFKRPELAYGMVFQRS